MYPEANRMVDPRQLSLSFGEAAGQQDPTPGTLVRVIRRWYNPRYPGAHQEASVRTTDGKLIGILKAGIAPHGPDTPLTPAIRQHFLPRARVSKYDRWVIRQASSWKGNRETWVEVIAFNPKEYKWWPLVYADPVKCEKLRRILVKL